MASAWELREFSGGSYGIGRGERSNTEYLWRDRTIADNTYYKNKYASQRGFKEEGFDAPDCTIFRTKADAQVFLDNYLKGKEMKETKLTLAQALVLLVEGKKVQHSENTDLYLKYDNGVIKTFYKANDDYSQINVLKLKPFDEVYTLYQGKVTYNSLTPSDKFTCDSLKGVHVKINNLLAVNDKLEIVNIDNDAFKVTKV